MTFLGYHVFHCKVFTHAILSYTGSNKDGRFSFTTVCASIEAGGFYFLKYLFGEEAYIGFFRGEASIREKLINNHILKFLELL